MTIHGATYKLRSKTTPKYYNYSAIFKLTFTNVLHYINVRIPGTQKYHFVYMLLPGSNIFQPSTRQSIFNQ